MKGAAPPPGHVPPPNDWPCLYPGCDRRDLPTGHTSCPAHREPFFEQQQLPRVKQEKRT